MNWRGAWSAAASYAVDDGVSSNGSSYLAVAANTNDLPPSANWNLIASVGAQGIQGPPGPPGVFWKAASFSFCSPTTGVTNCATVTFTAPAAGFVWLQASGYCNILEGGSVSNGMNIGWATTAGATAAAQNSGFIETLAITEAAANTQKAFASAGAFPVVAGSNSFFLNAHVYSGTASPSCIGTTVLLYSQSMLP